MNPPDAPAEPPSGLLAYARPLWGGSPPGGLPLGATSRRSRVCDLCTSAEGVAKSCQCSPTRKVLYQYSIKTKMNKYESKMKMQLVSKPCRKQLLATTPPQGPFAVRQLPPRIGKAAIDRQKVETHSLKATRSHNCRCDDDVLIAGEQRRLGFLNCTCLSQNGLSQNGYG